jgi:hypothetical protein
MFTAFDTGKEEDMLNPENIWVFRLWGLRQTTIKFLYLRDICGSKLYLTTVIYGRHFKDLPLNVSEMSKYRPGH